MGYKKILEIIRDTLWFDKPTRRETDISSLKKTETKLVIIFVIGAFLFLLIFEAFFISTRVILEDRFQKEEFILQVRNIIEWRWQAERNKRVWPPRIGINSIILDESNNIVEIRGNIDIEEFWEFINREELTKIPQDTLVTYNWTLFIKKKQKVPDKELSIIFFKRSWYPLEDIIRDIIRFLVIDLLLIIPFYFIGRYYVGRTLKPVGENIETMWNFIHDAGHELKTPLAIISWNLQILRDTNNVDTDIINESIVTLHSMADSLDGLIELANLKAPNKLSYINLGENIESQLSIHNEDIQKMQLNIELDISSNARIKIDKRHLNILLNNLLTNAIRYNKIKGFIYIRFDWETLIIEDTWIGIDNQDINKIFDRFYRVDRSGKLPWTGIWLTIVDRIIRLYWWDITIKSELWTWTTFTISNFD